MNNYIYHNFIRLKRGGIKIYNKSKIVKMKKNNATLMQITIGLIICLILLFSSISIAGIKTSNPPPFTLPNADEYESSTYINNGHSYSNDVVHPDILYFPNGWGDVNGSSYKYWMAITGYPNSNPYYEQPCILVSNNMSNDSWCEPADNYYNTNPITGWAWPLDSGGHYSDVDIVYNDDTDEIYCYFENNTGPVWMELYKTSDGVNWSFVSNNLVTDEFLSPAVIKEGNDWWMWVTNSSGLEDDPRHMFLYHSDNGIYFDFYKDCGYSFRVYPDSDPWHIDVVKYNNTYWGLLVEKDPQPPGYGVHFDLCFINSTDRENWTGYDSPILEASTDMNAWDTKWIYRSSCIIQDGKMQVIYTANSLTWHAGYTYNNAVGGTGNSSNIISTTSPSNTPPTANFNYEPQSAYVQDTVFFNSTSNDSDGSIVNWTWDFGDGTIGFGENVTHQYTNGGNYTVSLTVIDDDDGADGKQRGITIYMCGDADGNGTIDSDDINYLIDYIFSSGPAPDPLCEGDADGSDLVDIDDVTYLIAYIYSSGPPPVDDCCG